MIQAEPDATKNMESLNSIKVRSGNEMAPITQFVSMKKVYGPDIINRFNLYTSMKSWLLRLQDTLQVRHCRLLPKLLRKTYLLDLVTN